MQRGTRHTPETRAKIAAGVSASRQRAEKIAQQRAAGMSEAEIAASIIDEGLKTLAPPTRRAVEKMLVEGRLRSRPVPHVLAGGVEVVG
jgi:hypothetical protein